MLNTKRKLCLVNFLLGAGLYASVEVLFLQSIGISTYLISILVLIVPIISSIMEIPTGILGDYVGRRIILILTFMCFSISTLIIVFSKSFVWIFLAYSIDGLGYSFYSGNTESIVYENSGRNNENSNRALGDFYASLLFGYFCSGIFVKLIAFLIQKQTFKEVLYITLLFRLVATLITFSVAVTPQESIKKRKAKAIMTKALRMLISDKGNIGICLYEAMGRLQYFLPILYQPIFYHKGLSVANIAVIFSGVQLSQFISQKLAVILVDKYRPFFLMKVLLIAQVFSLLLLLHNSIVINIIGVLGVSAFISIKGQCTSLYKHNKASDESRSTFLSLTSMVTLLVNSAMLLVISRITGYNMILGIIILSGTMIIGSVIALCMLKNDLTALNQGENCGER